MELGNSTRNYEREPAYNLPELIDTAYPHVSIHDLGVTTAAFAPNMPSNALESLESMLQQIKIDIAPEGCTFYQIDTQNINASLESRCDDEIHRADRTVGVIHMDRHIGQSQQGERFARLDVSRDSDGQLTPRVGCNRSIDEQLQEVSIWASANQFDEIVFVDDVVAFGDTLPVIIEKLHQLGLPETTKLRALVAIAASGGSWNGIEKMREKTGIETEFLTKVIASPEIPGGSRGMALPVSRDLTLFGGRVTTLEDGTKYTHPYMLPFSKPFSSIIRPDVQIEASRQLIEFNQVLIKTLEEYVGRTLFIGDLQDKGIGLPHTSLESLDGIMMPPESSMPLSEYLGNALTALESNSSTILDEVNPKLP